MGFDKMTLGQSITLGSSGSAFGAVQTAVLSGTRKILPSGTWYVQGVSGVKVQLLTDNASNWVDLTPTGTGGMFFSDGYVVCVYGTGSALYYQIK